MNDEHDDTIRSLRRVNMQMKDRAFEDHDNDYEHRNSFKGPYVPKLYTVLFYCGDRCLTTVKMWELPRKDENVLFEDREYEVVRIVRDLEIYSTVYVTIVPVGAS